MNKQSHALKLAEIDQQMRNDDLTTTHKDIASWQASLQSVIYDAVNEQDIKEIVQNQVKKAKAGDQNAIKFVFSQIVGTSRPVNIKQTLVVTDVETASRMAQASKVS